jgi:hypothetical protein
MATKVINLKLRSGTAFFLPTEQMLQTTTEKMSDDNTSTTPMQLEGALRANGI